MTLHANEHLSWATRATDALEKFIEHQKGAGRALDKFMAEDVREWAERHGLPKPPDARAWGGQMQAAAKRGRIEAAGYAPSKNKQAHGRPTALWRLVL